MTRCTVQPPNPNPLPDHCCAELDGVCYQCQQTGDVLDRMRAAGLPVDAQLAQNQAQLQLAQGLRQQFFPGRA
jgi:hypothetical protein